MLISNVQKDISYTDLISDKVRTEEFFDQAHKEPVLRRIFRFVEKSYGDEPRLEKMIQATRKKYIHHLCKIKPMI